MAQTFGKSLVAMTPLPLDVWGLGAQLRRPSRLGDGHWLETRFWSGFHPHHPHAYTSMTWGVLALSVFLQGSRCSAHDFSRVTELQQQSMCRWGLRNESFSMTRAQLMWLSFSKFNSFYFYWSMDELQCCVTAAQQSNSNIHTFFFILFSIVVYHRISNIVHCATVRKSGKPSPTRLHDFLTSA